MNRRSFLHALAGTAVAAVAAPFGALAAQDGHVWIRSLNLADFGGVIPQAAYLPIRMPLDLTADHAQALAERARWEAWLAQQMARSTQ